MYFCASHERHYDTRETSEKPVVVSVNGSNLWVADCDFYLHTRRTQNPIEMIFISNRSRLEP